MVSKLGIEPIVMLDGVVAPLKCIRVETSCGGAQLDYAHVELDPAHPLYTQVYDPLLNGSLRELISTAILEVVLPLPSGQKLIHRGKVASINVALSDGGPQLHAISQVDPHHFGRAVAGMWIESFTTDSDVRNVVVLEPIVFNPMVDGCCIGNRSQRFYAPIGGNGSQTYFFLDWRQSQTEGARLWNQQGPLESVPTVQVDGQTLVRPQGEIWNLAEAVLYLCLTLNTGEAFVLNPNDSVLRNTPGLQRIIRDVQIPIGLFLPEALDRLLTPHGYTWKLVCDQPGQKPQIQLIELGLGPELTVSYQAPGEAVDDEKTNCESFHLQMDIARRLLNHVYVLGAPIAVEATWELVRAWSEDLDEATIEETAKGSPEWLANPALSRAYRDWVLNEDGSYVGLRPEITAAADIDTLLEGFEIGGQAEQAAGAAAGVGAPIAIGLGHDIDISVKRFYALRKRFYPTITLGEDGAPAGEWNGIRVQVSTDGGETWNDAGNENDDNTAGGQFGMITLLERECGIRFDEPELAPEFFDPSLDIRVRVTATIYSDLRLIGQANGVAESPSSDTVPAIFDLATRFALRLIHPSSTFYSDVASGTRPASTVDDRQAIQKYAEELLGTWNQADCLGSIDLVGVDRPAELGWTVRKIAGRELDLSTSNAGRYPQVVSISYDFRQQSTMLRLTAMRPTSNL